jgi:hypothetical protein
VSWYGLPLAVKSKYVLSSEPALTSYLHSKPPRLDAQIHIP